MIIWCEPEISEIARWSPAQIFVRPRTPYYIKHMGANALNTANMIYAQQVQYTLTTKIMQEDDIYIKVF